MICFHRTTKMISAVKAWWKNQKIRKSKFSSLFGLNVFLNVLTRIWNKICLWNTMPSIMAIPTKAKITRTNILIPVDESCHKKWLCAIWNLEYLIFKKLWPMSIFLNWSNVKVKRLSTYKKISSQGIFMWNIKALALAIQKLLAR